MKLIYSLALAGITGLVAYNAVALKPVPPQDDKAIQVASEAPAEQRPRIDVTFVLDTTGSMGGLIAGAKDKIWSIANEMMEAEGIPDIRFGLVGYRDRGDEYITRRYDLTRDLDFIYEKLTSFKADGGGDGPESVNQALHEAVSKMSWDNDDKTLKIVFLVGDAPPHMDYKDDIQYPASVQQARNKDIIINTVQCGSMSETAKIWKKIAKLGEGNYVALAQSGGMERIETPYDDDISKLTREQESTALFYGEQENIRANESKLQKLQSAPAYRRADKAAYTSKNAAHGRVVTGKGELLDDLRQNKIKLQDIPEKELPKPVVALPEPERAAYIQEQQLKRAELGKQVTDLVKKRDAYIKAEKAKRGNKDSFDEQVMEFVEDQAAEKGIRYKK